METYCPMTSLPFPGTYKQTTKRPYRNGPGTKLLAKNVVRLYLNDQKTHFIIIVDNLKFLLTLIPVKGSHEEYV